MKGAKINFITLWLRSVLISLLALVLVFEDAIAFPVPLYDQWKQTQTRNLGAISIGTGYLFSGGKGENVTATNTYANTAFKNNYLTSSERAEVHRLEEELKSLECSFTHGDGCPEIRAALDRLEIKSAENTQALLKACGADLHGGACQTHINEARAYAASNLAGSRYDVNIGLAYDERLIGQGKKGLDQSILAAFDAEGANATSLNDDSIQEAIHANNREGFWTGYFGEADDLKTTGELLKELDGLEGVIDSELNYANCTYRTGTCNDRQLEIEEQLHRLDAKDFILPRTAGGLALEVGTLGAGTVFKIGGKTVAKIGDEFVEVVEDGAGGYKATSNKIELDQSQIEELATNKGDVPEVVTRRDDDFYSTTGNNGRDKAHLDEDGNLQPANDGTGSTVQQVRGGNPSNQTSTTDPDVAVNPKNYGNQEIQIDTGRLQADIDAGRVEGVSIRTPSQVRQDLQDNIDKAQTRFDNNPNDRNSDKLQAAQQDLDNAIRDGECLISGCVPKDYITGPYQAGSR